MYTYTTRNGQRVEVAVAAAFDRLAAAFKARFGLTLLVSSGTRTNAEQWELYRRYKAGKGNLAAYPGTSNHEEGGPRGPRALDVRDSGGDAGVTVRGTTRANWLKANASKYGFNPAGYGFSQVEPWHIEFTGTLGKVNAPSSSQEVKNQQAWLNQARGEKLAVDGILGPATKAAIKRYQAFLGVTADGKWGPNTQKAHQAYYDKVTAPQKPTGGSSGVALKGWNVSGIQEMLRANYDKNLTVDGIFGPKSIAAFQKFLRNYVGTLTVDGKWGPNTAKAAQVWLQKRWGYRGAIDGVFGAGTKAAWNEANRQNAAAF